MTSAAHARSPKSMGGDLGGWLIVGAFGLVVIVAALMDLTGWIVSTIHGAHGESIGLRQLITGWAKHPGDPRQAFPHPAALPGPADYYLVAAILLGVVVTIALILLARLSHHRRSDRGMATASNIRRLLVSSARPGRITIGRAHGKLAAALPEHSVLVAGSTRSGKTSALAIPVILEWVGPIVVCSSKTDLFNTTYVRRTEIGPTWVFDPTGVSDPDNRNGVPRATWNPLAYCHTMTGALKVADAFTDSSPAVHDGGGTGYWKIQATALLAACMFAARLERLHMGTLAAWFKKANQGIDQGGQFVDAVHILTEHKETNPDAEVALDSLMHVIQLEYRQRDSAVGTCRACVEVYDDPQAVASSMGSTIDPRAFLDGQPRTLYLVATRQEQARLAPLFTALLTFIDRELSGRAARNRARDHENGMPIRGESERVLFVLDEVAKLAPMKKLPDIASEIGGEGGALLTIVQDFAQLKEHYKNSWASLVNNHPVRIALAGIADRDTQEWFSDNTGRALVYDESRSRDSSGRSSASSQPKREQVMDRGAVRLQPDNTGLVVALNLKPFTITLRPWFKDKYLRSLVVPVVAASMLHEDYEIAETTEHLEESPPAAPPESKAPTYHALIDAVNAGSAQRIGLRSTAPIFFEGTYYTVSDEHEVSPVTNPAEVAALDMSRAKLRQREILQAYAAGQVDKLGDDPSMPFRYEGTWFIPSPNGPLVMDDAKQIEVCERNLTRIQRAQRTVDEEQA